MRRNCMERYLSYDTFHKLLYKISSPVWTYDFVTTDTYRH